MNRVVYFLWFPPPPKPLFLSQKKGVRSGTMIDPLEFFFFFFENRNPPLPAVSKTNDAYPRTHHPRNTLWMRASFPPSLGLGHTRSQLPDSPKSRCAVERYKGLGLEETRSISPSTTHAKSSFSPHYYTHTRLYVYVQVILIYPSRVSPLSFPLRHRVFLTRAVRMGESRRVFF